MKKLLCTLFVAMFTMVTVAFALPIEPAHFTVTNQTTKETKRIPFSDFVEEDGVYKYDILYPSGFVLGFCKDDKITVSYGGGMSGITRRLIWTYNIEGRLPSRPDTSLSTVITIPSFTPDSKTLYINCSYQDRFNAMFPVEPTRYAINIKNVHNDNRFYSSFDSWNHQLRVTYKYYQEQCIYMTNNPYVSVTDAYTGDELYKGCMNGNGEITFNTGGRTTTVIISVTVNGVTLPAEKTYIW